MTLTEQEIMNNALKDMLFHEEMLAKKYSDLGKGTNDPSIRKMLYEMEVAAHSRHQALTEKMSQFGIV